MHGACSWGPWGFVPAKTALSCFQICMSRIQKGWSDGTFCLISVSKLSARFLTVCSDRLLPRSGGREPILSPRLGEHHAEGGLATDPAGRPRIRQRMNDCRQLAGWLALGRPERTSAQARGSSLLRTELLWMRPLWMEHRHEHLRPR